MAEKAIDDPGITGCCLYRNNNSVEMTGTAGTVVINIQFIILTSTGIRVTIVQVEVGIVPASGMVLNHPGLDEYARLIIINEKVELFPGIVKIRL